MGPGDLEDALRTLVIPRNPNVLAGLANSEDAGVYLLRDDLAIVQTIDFFTPIVDDPYLYGRVAAANSLSDIYAMGGKPITAMNVVCFPGKKLSMDVLTAILDGGLATLEEAGAALLGGHSVEDDEPKYGLSVTGVIHPDRIMLNSGLLVGDALILTKPLGTGVLATAGKASMASEADMSAMIASMCMLNRAASETAVAHNVKACTDITGFGLAGHLVEMARGAQCSISIEAAAVPLFSGALEAAKNGMLPGGAYSNRTFFSPWITVDPAVPLSLSDLMFDPQTSGGLLIGISKVRAEALLASLKANGSQVAAIVGYVTKQDPEGSLEIR